MFHVLRFICPKNSKESDIEDSINQWLEQHVDIPQRDNGIEQKGRGYGENYVTCLVGTFSFAISETKSDLIDELENILQENVNWYIVGYHACDHRNTGDDKTGCQWNSIEEFGNVPEVCQL